jgi:hypothetical protein
LLADGAQQLGGLRLQSLNLTAQLGRILASSLGRVA